MPGSSASRAAISPGSAPGSRVSRPLAAGQPEGEPGARSASRVPRSLASGAGAPGPGPQLRRAAARRLAHARVELPDAGEAAGERHFGDRHAGLGQQPPRGLQSRGPGQGLRAGAQLGHEQPVQVPLGDRQPRGQAADSVGIDVAVRDQPHRPGGQIGPDVPFRRSRAGLRAAPPAGPEPGRLRGRRVREEPHVDPGRGARRADRPAVDPGAGDPGEEAPVEARVAGHHGPVAGVGIECHVLIQRQASVWCWRESDLVTRLLVRWRS